MGAHHRLFPPTSSHLSAMAPMKAMKEAMTGTDICKAIGENAGLKTAQVKGLLADLTAVATAEVKKTGKFVVPHMVMLKLKHKPATKAGKRIMFGKEVKVAAKPAKKVVKAFPAKALKDSI